jgi:hypothetical protein
VSRYYWIMWVLVLYTSYFLEQETNNKPVSRYLANHLIAQNIANSIRGNTALIVIVLINAFPINSNHNSLKSPYVPLVNPNVAGCSLKLAFANRSKNPVLKN